MLQYAYTQSVTLTASFFKQMAKTYGKSIRPKPLRYAMLAYSAFNYPRSGSEERYRTYLGGAYHELRQRFALATDLQDSDAFTAMILAWISICAGNTAEAKAHGYGCIRVLKHIPEDESSAILVRFRPLIADNISSVLNMAGDAPSSDLPNFSFNHRLLYYQLLCETGTPRHAWQPPEIEVTYNYLRGALGMVLHSLQAIVSQEFLFTNVPHDNVLQYLHTKLKGSQFLQTYSSIENLLRDGNEHEGPRYQIVQFLSIGCMSLQLLQAISESQNTLDGINGHAAAFIGARLQTAIRTAGTPLLELYYYRDLYYIGCALCGLLLRPSEPYQGIYPAEKY
jgi:hypothetical protein